MQNKLTQSGDLLNASGELVECGYATSLIKHYDRTMIKAGKLRIKEWDYYLIYNSDFGVALTIDDNSYMGLNSVSLLNFKERTEITKSPMKFMTLGKTNFPSTSKIGDVSATNKNYKFEFKNDGTKRELYVWLKNFSGGKDITINILLQDEPKDSMVIVTPFKENKKAFYYNQKIVGLKASGSVLFGNEQITFDSKNTRAILDWGRGVWTYKNTWYWGAGTGVVDGAEVGFNIGYGFGDTSAASENMVFYNGKAHKLTDVSFNIPKKKNGKEDFLAPWTFSSSDGRFEMNFTPLLDRHANSDILIIASNQHQVFGLFNGTIILDDGKKVTLNNFLGFAEKVVNKW